MSETTITGQIRLWLDRNPGFHSAADIAKGLGLDRKAVSSALSRLAKQDRVLKEGSTYADPNKVTVNGQPVSEPDEDLIGETPAKAAPAPEKGEESPEPLFYEYLDMPGNYSIVTAPLAVEIADAAGVPTKVETFAGKLTRRVHFGGDDMDLASRTVSLVQQTVADAMDHLHDWQKKHIEERKGLTDMQKYLQHREQIAKFGSKVARQVKKNGV